MVHYLNYFHEISLYRVQTVYKLQNLDPSKVCMNFDSSTGCEREMFGHLQHNNRVGDALIMIMNVKIFEKNICKISRPLPF